MSKLRHFLVPLLLAIFGTFLVADSARAISPSATTGHLTVTRGAGTPTGVPALTNADQAADYFDTSANRFYLYNAGWQQVGGVGVSLLAKETSNSFSVTGSGETSLYAVSIPGNTLGTDGKLRLRILGNMVPAASGAGGFTVKVKYGGSSFSAVSNVALVASSSSGSAFFTAELNAANATGAQTVHTDYRDPFTPSLINRGTYTIDSTTSQSLQVTLTFNSVGNSFLYESAYLELLK